MIMKRLILLTISLMLFFTGAFAQINFEAPLVNDPSVRYGKLENGLTYYIKHNAKPEQRAEFFLVANVGAIEETPAQDGLAHFFEHMALNGSKHLPGKMMLDYFQTIGVEFGRNINASTGVEQTMYLLSNIPVTRQSIIDTALLTLLDWSSFVTNDHSEVEKERGVIIEEWRTRRTAQWRMQEKMFQYLFKGSKYATTTIIGDVENLRTFHPEEIEKFYRTWYRPDLLSVVVVGDIDVDAIEKQVKEMFKDMYVPENPQPKIAHQIPSNEEPIVGIITDPEALATSLMVVYKTQAIPEMVKGLTVYKLDGLMKSMISSMLNERLSDISSKPDAPFNGASISFGNLVKTSGAIMESVSTKDGKGLEGLTSVLTEVERAKRFGFTESEYDRAKTNYLKRLERAMENAASRTNQELVNGYISHFLQGEPYMTPEENYNISKQILDFLPVVALNQGFAQMFPANDIVVVYQAPEKAGLVHPTEQQIIDVINSIKDLDLQPIVEEANDEPLLDESLLKGSPVKKTKESIHQATEWTLKNGTKVVVKPTEFKKDEVLIQMSLQGGQSLVATEDLPSIEGNVFAMYQSNSGVSKFSQTELRKKLTGRTANVSPYIASYEHGISASGSPKDIETMLQLAYLYVTDPRFVESEYNVPIGQLKNILPNYVKTPDVVFHNESLKYMYNNHPRALTLSVENLEKADFNTLQRVYKELFSNCKDMQVTIVGNVDPQTIKPLIEKYIGSMPVGKKATTWRDNNEDMLKGFNEKEIKVDMTTPKSTVMLVSHADVPYSIENIVTANALSYILDLVYTRDIREEEGGTYGVRSSVGISRIPKGEATVTIQFDTNKEQAQGLSDKAIKCLKIIAENGPEEEHFRMAKENAFKNIPEQRIHNNYWSSILSNYYKTGVDRDSEGPKSVEKMTAKDVQNLAKKILDQGNFIEFIMYPNE